MSRVPTISLVPDPVDSLARRASRGDGGRWVRLDLVEVEAPNGERWEHHVVHLDRVTIALLVNDRDEVLMLHRYRFAIDKWGYELLGGIVESGEDSAATAKREALEERGWRPLGEPLERLDPTFIRAETGLRVDLAFALAASGERSEARTQAEHAGQLAIQIGSARQRRRMKDLVTGLEMR